MNRFIIPDYPSKKAVFLPAPPWDAGREVEKARFIIDTIQPFVTLVNKHYEYEALNRAFVEALGKGSAEAVGSRVEAVWGGEKFNRIIKDNLDRCFSGEEVHDEDWIDFPGSGRRYCDVVYSPYSPDGRGITHAVPTT